MAISNRDLAINHLRNYWFNQTPMAALGFVSFSDALAHYEQLSPNFLENIGSLVKPISSDKVKAAWGALAKQYQHKYPPVGAFYDSLATQTLKFTASDAKAVVTDTAKDIAKVATFGFGGLAIGAGVVAAIYFGVQSGAFAKLAKSVSGKALKVKRT